MASKLALFSICLLVSILSVYSAAVLESGIRVTPAAQAAIDKIKAGQDFRYGVFLVRNETTIDLETTGTRSSTYDQFLKTLKVITPAGKACRYGLDNFEVQCQSSPAKKKDKLILMSYCPDEVKVREKFIHAASVEGMKKAVTGYSAFIQASDDEEASIKTVQDKLKTTQTPC